MERLQMRSCLLLVSPGKSCGFLALVQLEMQWCVSVCVAERKSTLANVHAYNYQIIVCIE